MSELKATALVIKNAKGVRRVSTSWAKSSYAHTKAQELVDTKRCTIKGRSVHLKPGDIVSVITLAEVPDSEVIYERKRPMEF